MLKNWDVYSKMLSEYNSQDAVGSAMEEAQKTANSWEGQLNKLSNTWTKFVQNFVDTDFVKTGISGVSSFIDILDKLIDKFGILGGVITPIVATVMTVKNKGITDIFNSFKSSEKYKSIETGLFGTSKALSTEDVASLKNYNKLLEQGKSSTEAFDIALSNGSQSVKNMAINAAGSTVKLKTMTVAERAAAVGAKLMGSALKIAAGFLIGIAIDGLITWIDNVVHAEEKAKEKLEELYTQSKETTQKNLDEVKSLQENLATYQELSKKVSLTAQDKETLLSIQNDLINKYGIEAKNIDLLTGKYKENNAELKKIIVNKAKDALISAKTEYSTAKSSANNITNGEELYSFQAKREDFGDMSGLIDRYADMIQESTHKVATRTRSAFWMAMGQMFPWGNVSDDVTISLQKDLSLKDQIIAIQDILDGLNKNTDEYEKKETKYIDLTTSLNEKLKERQEIFDKINEALGDVAKAQIAVYQANNPIDTENITETQYNEWKDNLLSQFKDDPDLQSVIQSQLETTYADLEVKFDVKPSQDSNMFDITQYSEDIDNLQTKIKSLKETLSKLKDGSITQDELIDFTQEYSLTEYLDDLPELQKQIEKLLKTSPDDLINTLSELRDNVDETDSEKITELIIVLRRLGDTSESVDSVSESIQRLEDEISAIDEQLSKLNDEKKSLEDTISTIESNNSNIVSAYEYQVDKVINKLQDEVNVHQRIVDKYEAKNELLEDENDKLQDQADIIQEILDNYDTSSNVVQNFIDKQIDSLEERKSKIQEENDSLNETINLEEKLNNLRNAKRKRVRIYNEQGGWQLGEDTSAVQSAEKEYRDAVTDKKTSDIDKQIEGWRNYAQQWSDTADNINNKQNELTANEILGSNWREKITNKDIGILKKFGSEYTNYKNKLENNINAKIKKNEADIKKNEEVIKAENKVIKSKNAVIDKWQEYKNKLSDFVDETSKKSNEYINSLSNVTLSEKSSYSDRTKFFNDYKQALVNGYKEISDAKAQLDGVENTIGSLEDDKKNKENQKSKLENQQKSDTTTKKQYKLVNTKTGSIVGTSENKKSLEKAKADLDKTLVEKTIRKQFANVPEPTRSKAIKSLIDEYTADDKAIEEYLKRYKLNNKYVIKSYSTGGTVDYTGLANVHGSKSNSEVIFNSAQAKKLYDFIANTGNLSEVIGRQVVQDLGNKTINNIVNNNDKADNSKTNITIRVDKIVTPNANDFMNQMTNLIRQSNRNRMVGK